MWAWQYTRTQENITKRLAFSQQETIRLQGTDNIVWQRQTRTTNNKNDPQKKHRLGTVRKNITGGLKHVWRYQPHTYFWSRRIDVWLAWKIPNLSIYHLGDKTKIRTQQYIQLITGAKEIQQLNPQTHHQAQALSLSHVHFKPCPLSFNLLSSLRPHQ